MQDDNNLLFKLEQDIALLLVNKLEHLEITFERASQIAKFVLRNLPENLDERQIKNIVPLLDDQFVELAEVVNNYIIKFEEDNKGKVYDKAKELVENGQFDEAHSLIKEFFEKRNILNLK